MISRLRRGELEKLTGAKDGVGGELVQVANLFRRGVDSLFGQIATDAGQGIARFDCVGRGRAGGRGFGR